MAGDIIYMPMKNTKKLSVGEQLRYFRCKKGITIEQAGKDINVHPKTISRFEIVDNRKFELQWVKKYIDYLDCLNELELDGYVGFILRNPAVLIKNKRTELNMTVQSFSRYTKISDNTISGWEKGVIPSESFWKKLKNIFPDI